MRQPVPEDRPVCLTIAGSDSGGGAGIQADLKTMEAIGAFGTSAITAVTAQNTQGVESTHVLPPSEVRAQIEAVVEDFDVRAIKTGMLATAPIVETVTDIVATRDRPLVVDPVMVAATGDRLLDAEAEAAYEPLLEAATVVTPNADEATVLTDRDIDDHEDQIAAGEILRDRGATAALIKGGHLAADPVQDVFVGPEGTETFEHPRVDSSATHGSGCTLASAIAARLGQGARLSEAVGDGLAHMERAVRYPLDVGDGPGAVHHLADLRNEAAKPDIEATVSAAVDDLLEAPIARLVPEVGMNVAGATPYAAVESDVAAVEGRIARTPSGARETRGIALGASSHVARFLLAVREHDPEIRFALNCRNDEEIRAAIDRLGWPTGRYDRADQPQAVREQEGSTMAWGATQAISGREEAPAAVFDPGAPGKEPITKLLAEDAATLVTRTTLLAERLAA